MMVVMTRGTALKLGVRRGPAVALKACWNWMDVGDGSMSQKSPLQSAIGPGRESCPVTEDCLNSGCENVHIPLGVTWEVALSNLAKWRKWFSRDFFIIIYFAVSVSALDSSFSIFSASLVTMAQSHECCVLFYLETMKHWRWQLPSRVCVCTWHSMQWWHQD